MLEGTAMVLLLVVLLLVSACSGDGAERAGERTTTTTTEPGSCSGADLVTTTDVPSDVPEEVATTLMAARSAAQRCDYRELADLALADGDFTASFGEGFDDAGSLADHWQQLEHVDGEPLTARIVRLVQLPKAMVRTTGTTGEPETIYVSPRALHEDSEEARQEVVEAFGAEAETWWAADDQYVGWRIGVSDSGEWRFLVHGD
jgi:hypothetical protein